MQARERGAFRAMTTSTYDVHNACNLKCEGCSYFVTDRAVKSHRPSDDHYDDFFRSEAARGVNYPIFSGAEPSLNQGPLRIAAKYWQDGSVYTNGIKAIDADLPFRIVLSVWGGSRTSAKLRGANNFWKALAAAERDERAIMFFTITRESVEDIPEVVDRCAERGIPLTFNLYSMSSEYSRRLDAGTANDDQYFRFSSSESNLALGRGDRARAADLIDRAIDEAPDTVVLRKSLNDFMCRAPSLHTIDPVTKRATDCAILNSAKHRSFNYDLSRDDRKDCTAPDFDCRDCRVLGAALATLLHRTASEARRSRQAAHEFLELRRLMMRLYYWRDQRPALRSAMAAEVAS